MKICLICKNTFTTIKNGGNRGYCFKCLPTSGNDMIERRNIQRRVFKEKAVELLGGKCVRCGYNKSVKALHFHHVNPSNKKYNVSTFNQTNWLKFKEELNKCILVCANCHAEIHEKMDGLVTEAALSAKQIE